MANVCLIRPPFFKIYGVEKVHFPLSIGYLASYLEKGGHNVKFVDAEVLDYHLYDGWLNNGILNSLLFFINPYFIEHRTHIVSKIMRNKNDMVWNILIDHIARTKPDIIGISCYTVNMTAVNILAERIKLELGDVPIVLGGIHPTSLPQKTLQEVKHIDYVVVGEGEETLLDLVNNISDKKQRILEIDGALSRKSDYFKPRRLIENLDSVPFPHRYFYDKSKYIFGAPLLTSRGCPFFCTFCASHLLWTRKVRYRSVDNVIAELRYLKEKFGTQRIRILDDTFILDKKWIIEFCASLKSNKLNFTFNCSARVNTIDEELLRILHDCGFDSISFGIESGSQTVIERIKKEIDLSRVTEAINLAHRYGFDTTSFYMTGHPGETVEDIKQSEELFRKSKSKYGLLSMLVPYFGTVVGDGAQKMGFNMGIDDYYKFHHASDDVLFNMTSMSDEALVKEHKKFEKLILRRNCVMLLSKIPRLVLPFATRKLN